MHGCIQACENERPLVVISSFPLAPGPTAAAAAATAANVRRGAGRTVQQQQVHIAAHIAQGALGDYQCATGQLTAPDKALCPGVAKLTCCHVDNTRRAQSWGSAVALCPAEACHRGEAPSASDPSSAHLPLGLLAKLGGP